MAWDTTDTSDIDALLGTTLGGTQSDNYEQGISGAAGVVKSDYAKLVSFQNVISYSMEEVLNTCPRKFQIAKLKANSAAGRDRINNVTFAFGHAVGAGVAVYDKTQDLQQAIFAAFLAWDIDLFAEDRGRAASGDFKAKYDPKKSFAFAIWAIQKYAAFYEEYGMAAYEVVELEATVCVDLQNSDEVSPSTFHTGHVDELLRHRMTGKFKVKENKTTAFATIDPAMYSNSNQATGYSVVVAQHGATDYDVLYTIYSSTEQRWVEFEFTKHELARVEWLKTELMQGEDVQRYAQANYFPKRGSACFKYSRQCEEYGSCDLNLDKQFGIKFKDLPVATMALLHEVEPFQYVVTKDQIVQSIRASMKKDQS